MTVAKSKTLGFKTLLATYQARIEEQLKSIAKDLQTTTYEHYGAYPTEAVSTFTDILLRGGKRIRGSLAICAYEIFGGKDNSLINKAAAGLEMLNTYILIADDIQDRSELRRGGPTAHIQLRNYHHQHKLKDDAEHFGQSIAINSMLIGMHAAMNVFATLPTDANRRLKVIEHTNTSFITTAHGQSLDIFNEVVAQASKADIDNVLAWKTAQYSLINPLQLGAILAKAKDDDLVVLAEYGSHTGRLFQITDDILGVFGDKDQNGKSPLDDIKEGKRTMLTTKAIELAPKADAYFLEQMLGNQNLTMVEFKKSQQIIESSGALEFTTQQAKDEAAYALDIVNKQKEWPNRQVSFLSGLVSFLLERAKTV